MPRPHKPGLATMWSDDDPLWNEQVDVLRGPDPHRPLSLPVWLWRFWRQSRGRRAVVLRGTVHLRDGYRDLLATVLLRHFCLWRRVRGTVPLVVVSDATITPYSRKLGRRLGPFARILPALARLLVRAGDGPGVRWCVLSTPERSAFAQAWGVPVERVLVTPFRHTLWEAGPMDPDSLPPIAPPEPGEPVRVFAGGDSLRDYPLLLQAFAGIRTPARLCVATSEPLTVDDERVVVGHLDEERYRAELESCHVLVVPLAASSRSAGQQTYLNGMALGKVVLVADPLGAAHDYLDADRTGLVVAADPAALRDALEDVLVGLREPVRGAHLAAMRSQAREAALGFFSPESYRRRLLTVAGLTLDHAHVTARPDVPAPRRSAAATPVDLTGTDRVTHR